MLAMLGTNEVLLILLILPLMLGAFAFWLWMLVDAIRNRALTDSERIAWVIAICLLHALGALVYLLFGRGRPSQAGGPRPTS